MSGTKKSDNANMNFSAGENSSTQIPAINTVFHEGKTYFIHPIYTNYCASEDGYIINRKRLIPRKGRLRNDGYFDTTVYFNDGKQKTMQAHRFIWESINQQIISDEYEIHHINCDKQDNSIVNLQLVTRQQNMIYAGKESRGKTKSKPQNVTIKCEKIYYHPIYTNFGANKHGQIYNKKTNRCSIGNLNPNGYMYTILSQFGLPNKNFRVHRLVYECIKGDIPDKMEINHIDSNKQNNCINNLELMTRSENLKHAFAAKKYKTKIEITTDKPIESIKLDIKMKESDDDFTENEKQLIDKKYNAMMNKINKGDYPYRRQLREHLPNMEFW